ncbi:flavin reductase family protein [Actinoplanes sp. NPDC051851]|uniref:flavin reductase family protein n=1 Tax=Actinoplanes sp. NPDC051851 TaxID=3154753 RepID=UPI0034494A3F
MSVAPAPVDTAGFRRVFGHFCTGVTVITTADREGPAGFACQAFAPLSLDPPLVLFCVRSESATGERIRQAGAFAVNVLAEAQRPLSRLFGTHGADRFTGVGWTPAPSGAPILDGVLAWADCRIEAVHPGGDHDVVIGRVTTLGDGLPARPLLFHRGRYRTTADSAGGLPHRFDWPAPDDWI